MGLGKYFLPLVWLLLCGLPFSGIAAEEDRPAAIQAMLDRVLNLRRIGQGCTLALSPDGRTLAATVESPHNQSLPERQGSAPVRPGISESTLGCEVMLIDTKTGQLSRPFCRYDNVAAGLVAGRQAAGSATGGRWPTAIGGVDCRAEQAARI